jgi:tripartite-type tricarboxylate transporter receptor subunit TctC
MSKAIGQPVIIENMPGAGGATAALAVARAAPDGHSMLWVSSQNAIAPSMFKALPYDLVAGFHPDRSDGHLRLRAVRAQGQPAQDRPRRDRGGQEAPDKFNFGSIAVGTAQNLSTLNFVSMAGLNVPTVPFRSTGEVVTGLLSGNIQAAFETIPGVIGQIQGGSLAGDRGVVQQARAVPARCADRSPKAACPTTGPIPGTAWCCRPRRRPTS